MSDVDDHRVRLAPRPAGLPPVDEVDEVDVDDAPTSDRRSRALVVACVLAVVFFAVAVAMTIVAASVNAGADDTSGDRANVARVAGQLTEALLDYDYRDLDGFEATLLGFAVADFRIEVRASIPGLIDEIIQAKMQSDVKVNNVYLGEIEDDTATAIVEADHVVITEANGASVQPTLYLQISLVKLEGTWKVAGVLNVNLAVLGDTADAFGESTTTTTGG